MIISSMNINFIYTCFPQAFASDIIFYLSSLNTPRILSLTRRVPPEKWGYRRLEKTTTKRTAMTNPSKHIAKSRSHPLDRAQLDELPRLPVPLTIASKYYYSIGHMDLSSPMIIIHPAFSRKAQIKAVERKIKQPFIRARPPYVLVIVRKEVRLIRLI